MKPVMEAPHMLKNLLDTLFCSDVLKMWQIYEEPSGSICVKIRFNGRQPELTENSAQNTQHLGTFKRRSDAQCKRDRDRAARHQMITRSQTDAVVKDEDEPLEMSVIEEARSGDFTLESPNCFVGLNPLASPFPNPPPHEDPYPAITSPYTLEVNCTVSSQNEQVGVFRLSQKTTWEW